MQYFEWDEPKNEGNIRKHEIDFDTACRVFDDQRCFLFIERGEESWHTIGVVPGAELFVVVVHTYLEEGADEVIRIISARRASAAERRIYEEANT